MSKQQKEKNTYTVIRIVKEIYEVTAESKEKAKLVIKDPYKVAVISQKIKLKLQPHEQTI